MKSSAAKFALPVLTIGGLLLMVAWIAGMFDEKIAPGQQDSVAVSVDNVVTVVKEQMQILEPVPATIQAKQATIISSRILSRIERVHVRAGDSVAQGQLLVELEAEELKSRVSQAEARISVVRARLKEAQLALERALDLKQTGAIARAELETAEANRDALVAELANAKQGFQEAETALGFARIVAPIDGRIVDRFAEPGDTAQPGIQLLSIYNPLSLRVEANVRETLALSLNPGQNLDVLVPSVNRRMSSTIEEVVPAGNTGSRSFLIKCRLPFSEGLLPGMYARIHVPAGYQTRLLVPVDRVAEVGQLDVAWVFHEGVSERRFIRRGKMAGDGFIEVVSGLSEGDQVLPVP